MKLNVTGFRNTILKGTQDFKLLCFYAEEEAFFQPLMHSLIETKLSTFHKKKINGVDLHKNLPALIDSFCSYNFFTQKTLLIIENCSSKNSADIEALWPYLTFHTKVILLSGYLYPKNPLRIFLENTESAYSIPVFPPTQEEMRISIQHTLKKYSLPPESISYLATIFINHPATTHNELKKLQMYLGDKTSVTHADIKKFLEHREAGTLQSTLNSFFNKEPIEKVLAHIDMYLESGASPFLLIRSFLNTINKLLIFHTPSFKNASLTSSTKLPIYINPMDKKLYELWKQKWEIQPLLKAYSLIFPTELQMKKHSEDPSICIKQAFVQYYTLNRC